MYLYFENNDVVYFEFFLLKMEHFEKWLQFHIIFRADVIRLSLSN